MIRKTQHTYGWQPDIPDSRDYLYYAIKPVIKLPRSIDLRKQCSTIENQGTLGSCTAQALAGNLEFLDNMLDKSYIDVSRLFIYYNERLLMDTVDYDSGASLRVGIKTLRSEGSCPETMWPYDIKKFDVRPKPTCYLKARGHVISAYHRIATLNEMLTCLADGYPFVFGFTVYESFETAKVSKTGIVDMPDAGESAIGGHAVVAVGYDQKTKRFLIRNSWGEIWGMKGYFTMPFEYLESLADDFWTIRK